MKPRTPYGAKLVILALLIPAIVGLMAGIHPSINTLIKTLNAPSLVRLTIAYSSIFLCFFAGCLWAFTISSPQKTVFKYLLGLFPLAYLLSPLMTGGPFRLVAIALGYVALLAVDIHLHRHSIVPDWWVRFKTPLTIVIMICIIAFQFRHLLSATFGFDVRP